MTLKLILRKVVLYGIGIPASLVLIVAITWPIVFTSRPNRTPETQAWHEARLHVSILNRVQQAHYLEKGHFSDSIETLALGGGIDDEIETNRYYRYAIALAPDQNSSQQFAIAKSKNLTSFTGLVWQNCIDEPVDGCTTLCKSNEPTTTQAPVFSVQPDLKSIECPKGYGGY